MSITTSLSLQALLKAAVARSGMEGSAARIAGLMPQAQALCVAGAAGRGAVLLVVPADPDVDRLTADVRFFLAAMEGLSAAAVERAVLPFPSWQVDPYRGLTPHFRIASARARALHALASDTVRVVVASAAALLPRLSHGARLLDASIELRPGQEIAPHDLAALLVDAGFTREDPVDEHGEFGVRGGIVDLYPAGEAQPVRLEFIGDTIESLRRYDPATQRSVAPLDQLVVVPLRETFEDGPAEAGRDAGSGPAPDDAVFVASGFSRTSTVFDYLPSNIAIYVSEPEEVAAQAARVIDQVSASYADLVAGAEAAGGPASTPADLFVEWRDVEAGLARGTRLEQLAIGATEETTEAGATAGQAFGPQPSALGHERAHNPRSPAPSQRIRAVHVPSQPVPEFRGRIGDWVAEIRRSRARGDTVLVVVGGAGLAERTVELLAEYELRAVLLDRGDDLHGASALVAVGGLSGGFRLPGAELQIFAETDLFEEERRPTERRRSLARTFLSDLRDLKVGDLVVHVDHGIGTFAGLKEIRVAPGSDATQEFMELRYAADDKLFVPVERLDLVQKYSGATRPPLDRLGGASWERAKTRVRKAMRDMAEELLKLYAARKAVTGHVFGPDTHWQQEFEDAFEYELTTDQVSAIADIKKDMEQAVPMDRLLCGDVGYGKTEVAMRAAFKAVMDGKQAAILAPTTVLAFQHLKTLRERFAGFPVSIDMVSRFRTRAEQTQVLAELAAGKVDIIVGTHRLLSKDVIFRDLGLLIVDEEQRFGVGHKEKIKQLRYKVDVLTLTATPIPRTLNMSLVGIRDMSIIETPPKDRLSIQTNVVKFDQQVIARAVRNELARGGQVYVVHNRVESIFSIGHLITRLVPEARVVVGHGQMAEDELERAMLDFIGHKYDVLLATTIIENGLDIPNVNTIIINRADRYGLSQLYQLRGRVGRSDRPAYAYLLIPPEDSLSQVAKKRLAAIKEFSDLGSGFRVAALDLEIRGAGSLLGGEQSGHIETVGFEMYMKLLEEAVRALKGDEVEDDRRATVNLRVDLRIDEAYVPDMNQRLTVYRRIAGARREAELDEALAEIRDRYGDPPASVLQLVDYGRIRMMADRLGVEAVDRDGQVVAFRFRADARVDPGRLMALVRERPGVSLVPPVTLKLDLRQAAGVGHGQGGGERREAEGRGGGAARAGQAPAAAATSEAARAARTGVGPPAHQATSRGAAASGGGAPRAGKKDQPPLPKASWWATRATSGTVAPGFSRDEILRPGKEDPRGPTGVLTLVGDVLATLGAEGLG